MIGTLDHEGLLPAITFIFSRAGCDAAVKQCLRSSLRLTTDEERARIAEVIDRRCADLPKPTWSCSATTNGAKACCVGSPPTTPGCCRCSVTPSRSCSPPGLVKAVFATETLALGINMPARTVVLERLVKFNGEQHVPLTPGEYTQLTGRAGRRGIDVEGHAVVLWQPTTSVTRRRRRSGLHPDLPAAQFVCAVVQHDDQPGPAHGPGAGAPTAGAVLRAVPGGPVGRRAGHGHRARREDARRDRRRTAADRDAPILEYARLRAAISERERAQARASRLQRRRAANDALTALRRGDIITIGQGRRGGLAVVLEPAATTTSRGRWCSPNTVGREGFPRPTTPGRRRSWGR